MGSNPLYIAGNGFTDSPMGMYQQLKAGSHDELRARLTEVLGLAAGRHIDNDEIVAAVQRLVNAARPDGG